MTYKAGVYDIYDDSGRLLKSIVPDPNELPEFVKTASRVGQNDNNNLFALVMVEDGQVMKKYATADAGNTWLSLVYFLSNKHNLPEEAQKVAAAHLREAMDAFGGSEVFGSDAVKVIDKIAGDTTVESNLVDVSGKAPSPVSLKPQGMEEVEYAIERADGSQYYPLRDAKDVKLASQYFEQHAAQFTPRERRQYAVKVASHVDALGLRRGAMLEKYAAQTYNPNLRAFMTMRYTLLAEADAGLEAKADLMKLAEAQAQLTPESFADLLERFDCDNGLDRLWDRGLPDPWSSTVGVVKIASVPDFEVQGETIPGSNIESLASAHLDRVREHFGDSFASSFAKDPSAVFESMPTPQKKILAHLAQG